MKSKRNKIVDFVTNLRKDYKDHALLGLVLNWSVVVGFLLVSIFSIKYGVWTANAIGIGWIGYYAYTEYRHSQDPERKGEFLDWFWNSMAHLQTLIPLNIIYLLS